MTMAWILTNIIIMITVWLMKMTDHENGFSIDEHGHHRSVDDFHCLRISDCLDDDDSDTNELMLKSFVMYITATLAISLVTLRLSCRASNLMVPKQDPNGRGMN